MRIDKHLLRAAGELTVTQDLDRPEGDVLADTETLSGDPTVQTFIATAVSQLLNLAGKVEQKDLIAFFGTQFQCGFEVGIEYQKLLQQQVDNGEVPADTRAATAS